MAFVILGASVAAFIIYILFYRYFGIDARFQMFIIHYLVLAVIAGLAVLLWLAVTGDHGTFAVTAAIASIAAFGAILLKFFIAEFGIGKTT